MKIDLVKALARPEAYGPRNESAHVLKTLVNFVVLTDRHVYKFKQPVVRFNGGIDYSTFAKRRDANRKEFLINKKLSPFVHRSIVVLRRQPDGTIRLGGRGSVIEWGFQMRRLPEKELLSEQINGNNLSRADAVKLGKSLKILHHRLPSGPRKYATATFLQKRWRETLDWMMQSSLRRLVPAIIIKKLPRWVENQLEQLGPLFDQRAQYCQRIHGDLNAENVFFSGGRFHFVDINQYMREWEYGDPLNDLGAVVKDFDASNQTNLGNLVVSTYVEGNKKLITVVNFYKMYWATIRYLVYVDILGHTPRRKWKKSDIARKKHFERLVRSYCREIQSPAQSKETRRR